MASFTTNGSAMLNELPAIYYNRAVQLAREGALPEARDKVLVALELAPEMVDAHLVLGKISAQLGDYQRAIAAWRDALELDPDNETCKAGIRKAEELRGRGQRSQKLKSYCQYGLVGLALFLAALNLQSYLFEAAQTKIPPVDAIRTALNNAEGLPSLGLVVRAVGEEIRVAGQVETALQRQLVKAVAESKSDGFTVEVADVEVARSEPLALALRKVLETVGEEGLLKISVAQKGDVLFIAGEVPSKRDKARLKDFALAMHGVGSLDMSGLKVRGVTEYVVRRGDTLWDLARQFYGDGGHWPKIAAQNPHLADKYRQIQIGTRLFIPPKSQ